MTKMWNGLENGITNELEGTYLKNILLAIEIHCEHMT